MTIYGTALLSLCLLCGLILGELIGLAIGIEANVGGVGFAMLLLIVSTEQLRSRGRLSEPTSSGVLFWSSIYIPIVVAMAASQDVRTAVNGGAVAIVAGTAVVIISLALVPLLSRLGQPISAALGENAESSADGDDA
jgi:malonate transporter MadL subunit